MASAALTCEARLPITTASSASPSKMVAAISGNIMVSPSPILYGLTACAAAAAGALFGFLFAIPRTREAAAVAGRPEDPTAVRQAVLVANTNLERVSDWLTTLLLGATLVQIKPLADWISNLGTCTPPT